MSIEPGDLIATARGTKVEVCAAAPDVIGAFVSLDLYLIRPNQDRIIPEYLMAVLESAAAHAAFDGARQGSSLPRLPKAALENLSVPLPPLERQRTVVDLHRTLDNQARLLSELQAKHAVASAEFMRRAVVVDTYAR
ncbi:MAG: restriction endonuclease subunit S [Methylobacterium frigidaeris]